MLLLLLSVLLLLTQPWRSLGAEMKIYSQETLANGCNLVACSPPEGGLPSRDGQDGREDPGREKGDPGGVGAPGMQGSPGPEGLKGERGAPEETGASGRAGAAGPAGAIYPQGPSGARGSRGLKGDRSTLGERGAKEVDDLWQWVAVLEGQLRRLQKAFSHYKKAVLFPDGLAVGEKIFKTAGVVKSYSDARQICREARGQLASPRSAAENEAVTQLVRAKNKKAYLSMNDISTEGRFTYPTGGSLVYSNWASGEPNNKAKGGSQENCLEIYLDGNWNDIECSEQRLVICEF